LVFVAVVVIGEDEVMSPPDEPVWGEDPFAEIGSAA